MLLYAMNNKWLSAGVCLALGCLLFVATLRCEAQNLVPNPSFEDREICPYTIGFEPGGKPLHWEKWFESPEYFNACAGTLNDVDTVLDVPLNGFGYQYAFDGEGYVGMATFQNEAREYVGCELIEPLIVGQTYSLSFFANVATGGNYWDPKLASNNLGLLFTMEANIWAGLTGPGFAFRNYAHLYSQEILADTAYWVQVSGVFVADSAYPYLVIGNFFEDALTDTMGLEGYSTYAAYYFVDGVCVTQGSSACSFDTGMPTAVEDLVGIWPNPVTSNLSVVGLVGRYSVQDVMGRSITTGAARKGEPSTIEVAGWREGQYVLNGNEGLFVRRFVVTH